MVPKLLKSYWIGLKVNKVKIVPLDASNWPIVTLEDAPALHFFVQRSHFLIRMKLTHLCWVLKAKHRDSRVSIYNSNWPGHPNIYFWHNLAQWFSQPHLANCLHNVRVHMSVPCFMVFSNYNLKKLFNYFIMNILKCENVAICTICAHN